jgi:hypothetical protein
MVDIWMGQQSAYDAIQESETGGDIETALNDFAATVRETGEAYKEGAENQREYFPDSEAANENEEKGNALCEWADSLESLAAELASVPGGSIEIDEDEETVEETTGEVELNELQDAKERANEAIKDSPV